MKTNKAFRNSIYRSNDNYNTISNSRSGLCRRSLQLHVRSRSTRVETQVHKPCITAWREKLRGRGISLPGMQNPGVHSRSVVLDKLVSAYVLLQSTPGIDHTLKGTRPLSEVLVSIWYLPRVHCRIRKAPYTQNQLIFRKIFRKIMFAHNKSVFLRAITKVS